MAQKKRPTLKTYFEAGDNPTQGQYAHLIDSSLNLAETGAQAVTGSLIVSQSILVESHITASGNISASGIIYANDFKSSGGDVSGVTFHDDLNITGSLTASGHISSSRSIIGLQIFSDGRVFSYDRVGVYNTETNNFVANPTHPTEIDGTNIKLDAPVTASIISASGNIIADKFYAEGSLSKGYIAINQTNTHLGVNTGWTVGTNITASGNISSSGNIIGETGSFDNGIILTAPNGNKFRFTVNNSGFLSITGSAV